MVLCAGVHYGQIVFINCGNLLAFGKIESLVIFRLIFMDLVGNINPDFNLEFMNFLTRPTKN